MELAQFQETVRQSLDAVRESLARIEEEAQVDEDVRLLELSRHYAMLIGPFRDYLVSSQMGKPTPRALAKRLADSSTALMGFKERIAALGPHPDLDEIAALIQLAETAT